MDARVPHFLGSVITLVGAFAIGWVLHQVLVRGTLEPTGPVAVLVLLGGLAAIVLGRRVERGFDPSAYVADRGTDEEDEAFDESLSPVDEEMLEGRDRDDGS